MNAQKPPLSLMMLTAAAALISCGGNDTAPEPSDEVPTSEAQILREMTIGDTKLSFVQLGTHTDKASAALIVEGTVGSPDPVALLKQQMGPVTLLEAFKAFAPAGEAAPAVLEALDEDEGQAIGRRAGADPAGRLQQLKAAVQVQAQAQTASPILTISDCRTALTSILQTDGLSVRLSAEYFMDQPHYLCAGPLVDHPDGHPTPVGAGSSSTPAPSDCPRITYNRTTSAFAAVCNAPTNRSSIRSRLRLAVGGLTPGWPLDSVADLQAGRFRYLLGPQGTVARMAVSFEAASTPRTHDLRDLATLALGLRQQ